MPKQYYIKVRLCQGDPEASTHGPRGQKRSRIWYRIPDFAQTHIYLTIQFCHRESSVQNRTPDSIQQWHIIFGKQPASGNRQHPLSQPLHTSSSHHVLPIAGLLTRRKPKQRSKDIVNIVNGVFRNVALIRSGKTEKTESSVKQEQKRGSLGPKNVLSDTARTAVRA